MLRCAHLRTHFLRGAVVWKAPHVPSTTHTYWVPKTCRALEGVLPGSTGYYGTAPLLLSHGAVMERAQSSVLFPAQPFLGYRMLGQPVNGKRCEKRSLGQVEEVELESFGQGNRKTRPKRWDPKGILRTKDVYERTGHSGCFYDTAGQGMGRDWPDPIGARM